MRRISIPITGILILCWLISAAPSTLAVTSADYVNFVFSGNGTCTTNSISVPVGVAWNVSVVPTSTYVETLNGAEVVNGPFTTTFSGTGAGSGITSNHAIFSAALPYSYTFDITYLQGGTIIGHASATYRCSGNVAVLQGGAAARQIPGTFELRTITCDTAVFQSAGGQPVPTGERILSGQTWYINPSPVTVDNNKQYPSWTEIYVSGVQNGYIPTACVGPAPIVKAGGTSTSTLLSGDAGGGGPCSPEGSMVCSGTGFNTCDQGKWMYRACAPGTVCRQIGASILCDWPTS